MTTQTDSATPQPGRGRRWRAGAIAGGAALGLTLAGFGVAAAQTDTPTTTTVPQAPVPAPGAKHDGRGHRGVPEVHAFGIGGIHGEFVTPAPSGGGYETLATQLGEVTEVSSSSITIKSADGFAKTYGVDDNTQVNAGNNGIGDVKKGDTVRVVALKAGDKYNAVELHDGTQDARLRGRWMSGGGPGGPSPSDSGPATNS